MARSTKSTIDVEGSAIAVRSEQAGDYISLTDIAFEFAAWISAEFRLYLIREFQHLKQDENRRLSLEWNLPRVLSKINYRLQSQAIKAKLIPPEVSPEDASDAYRAEADILNTALFGQTAQEWRESNPSLRGNMRDYATVEQLLVLANLDIVNAELIHLGISQEDRLKRLNEIAINQMRALTEATPAIA